MSLHHVFLHLLSLIPPFSHRVDRQFGFAMPILAPAFEEDAYGQLLALFALDCIERKRYPAARRLLNRLEPLCAKGSDAEHALWLVLGGLYFMQRDELDIMTSAFDAAAEYNHTFHLPYLLSGDFHLLNSQLYDRALESYDRAISSLYRYLPLSDDKRYIIAQAHASTALCLTMMHRCGEAEDAMRKAEPARDSEEYLHARAILSAVQGDRENAALALKAFGELNGQMHERVANNVRMILDGTHIHFNVRPAAEGLAADFWRWFAEQESAFRQMLDKGDSESCTDLLAQHINTLVPDEEDMMTSSFELNDGRPEIILRACYSRSYAALIADIEAACPEEIRERWGIVTRP